MEKIIPHRAHPQLLHIRSYARTAEALYEAVEAFIAKRLPCAFLGYFIAAALFLKPFEQIIVELIAVGNIGKHGICAEAVYHEAVLGDEDIGGEIFNLADKGSHPQGIGNELIPIRNDALPSFDRTGLGNSDVLGAFDAEWQKIRIEKLGGFKLLVCDIKL